MNERDCFPSIFGEDKPEAKKPDSPEVSECLVDPRIVEEAKRVIGGAGDKKRENITDTSELQETTRLYCLFFEMFSALLDKLSYTLEHDLEKAKNNFYICDVGVERLEKQIEALKTPGTIQQIRDGIRKLIGKKSHADTKKPELEKIKKDKVFAKAKAQFERDGIRENDAENLRLESLWWARFSKDIDSRVLPPREILGAFRRFERTLAENSDKFRGHISNEYEHFMKHYKESINWIRAELEKQASPNKKLERDIQINPDAVTDNAENTPQKNDEQPEDNKHENKEDNTHTDTLIIRSSTRRPDYKKVFEGRNKALHEKGGFAEENGFPDTPEDSAPESTEEQVIGTLFDNPDETLRGTDVEIPLTIETEEDMKQKMDDYLEKERVKKERETERRDREARRSDLCQQIFDAFSLYFGKRAHELEEGTDNGDSGYKLLSKKRKDVSSKIDVLSDEIKDLEKAIESCSWFRFFYKQEKNNELLAKEAEIKKKRGAIGHLDAEIARTGSMISLLRSNQTDWSEIARKLADPHIEVPQDILITKWDTFESAIAAQKSFKKFVEEWDEKIQEARALFGDSVNDPLKDEGTDMSAA